MLTYDLYLESGPRQKKTMAHVLALPGLTFTGATTPEALAAAPDAIRYYLKFVRRHGGAADPAAPFTTRVVQHVMEGPWLGNGNPAPGFLPDFLPLSRSALETGLQHLGWMREDLLALIRRVPAEEWESPPPGGGRTLRAILLHTADIHAVYLRYLVGKVEGLPEALRAVQESGADLTGHLENLWLLMEKRLGALSDEELRQSVPHGQVTWMASRTLRRTLEHEWEHLQELSSR